jgi:hypothetical protein
MKTYDEGRTADWILLHGNTKFYPLDPRAEEITLQGTATGLAHENRFAGQTINVHGDGEPVALSVAQHAFYVCGVVSGLLVGTLQVREYTKDEDIISLCETRRSTEEGVLLQLAALHHDDPEGLGFRDIPTPVKRDLVGYKEAEARCMTEVAKRWGFVNLSPVFPYAEPPIVKLADQIMLATEKRDFHYEVHHEFDHPCPPLPTRLPVLDAVTARRMYVDRHLRLVGALRGLGYDIAD